MKRSLKSFFSLALILSMSVSALGAGVEWKNENGEISAEVTGAPEGSAAYLAVYKDGELRGVSSELSVAASDFDEAKVFLWDKNSLEPVSPLLSVLTPKGVEIPFGSDIWVSDNQVSNNSTSAANHSIEALSKAYRVSFYLTVDRRGDNAVLLGDSANGVLSYGSASATLLFTNSGYFSVRNGKGDGSYSSGAVNLCEAKEGETYLITFEGDISENTYTVSIADGDGNVYESEVLNARKNGAAIDTVALVSNSKNTVKSGGRYSDYNFHVNDFKAEALADDYFVAYSGFEGIYYGITADGKYIRGNNGRITVDYDSVRDNSAMFMPRNMGDGSYSLVCRSSNNRITAAESGERLASAAYASNDDTQHWLLEPSESSTEENPAYYLKSLENGLYIGVREGYLTAVEESERAELRFIALRDESPLYLVSETEAYARLSRHQRSRIETVYGSVAADAFGRYGRANEYTPRSRMDAAFTEILSGSLSVDEQEAKLRELLDPSKNYIFDWEGTATPVGDDLPGTEGAYAELGDGVYSERKDGEGGYLFWTNTYLSGTKYPLYIYNADGTLQQTLNLYVHDRWYAKQNANFAVEAIAQIPYVYRKYLKNIRVREDSANSFNGGGSDIYIRLGYTSSTAAVRNALIHELTHLVDSANGWLSGKSEWTAAMESDCFKPTTYSNSSNAEDFAEFGKVYFMCYNNRDMQRGLRIIMPERYEIFKQVRMNSLEGFSLWED